MYVIYMLLSPMHLYVYTIYTHMLLSPMYLTEYYLCSKLQLSISAGVCAQRTLKTLYPHDSTINRDEWVTNLSSLQSYIHSFKSIVEPIGFGRSSFGALGTGGGSNFAPPGATAPLNGPATSITCAHNSCCVYIETLKYWQCRGQSKVPVCRW